MTAVEKIGGGAVSRRRLLVSALAGIAVMGHTPYSQWAVYRKKHLLILTTKVDPDSFVLGKKVADVLLRQLPESRAAVSRAPHKERIASLISSKQMDLALMRPDDAAALRAGAAPYADYGPVELMSLAGVGNFLLVCRDDFAELHAYLVVKALATPGSGLVVLPASAKSPQPPDARLPLHSGSIAFLSGAASPVRAPETADHDH